MDLRWDLGLCICSNRVTNISNKVEMNVSENGEVGQQM